jgi:hypothetical protein
MLRALFLRELRKSWLAHAGLFAAIIGTATVLEHVLTRGAPLQPDSELPLSRLLIAGLALSGLISGERCFSAAFKGGRYPFFLTLPKSRGLIWLTYTGGRLIGSLAGLPFALLARPALLRDLSSPQPSFNRPILIAALAVYLAYFLGGAAIALAVRKEILVYLIGLPVLTALLGLLAFSASYGFEQIVSLESPEFRDFTLGCLVLALVSATLTKRTFCRGELLLWRHTAQALAEGGLAFGTFAILALIVFSNSTIAALGDKWQPMNPSYFVNIRLGRFPFPIPDDTLAVSGDGRFLFIVQQLQEHPRFKRVSIVDIKSGRLSGWLERPSIYQISWSPSGDVLNVLAANDTPSDWCLRIPCEGSTSWYRLAPDLHIYSVKKLPGVGFLGRLRSGGRVLVTWRGTDNISLRISDQGSRGTLIQRMELSTDLSIFWTKDLQAWLLDSKSQVLKQASEKDLPDLALRMRHDVMVSLRDLSGSTLANSTSCPSGRSLSNLVHISRIQGLNGWLGDFLCTSSEGLQSRHFLEIEPQLLWVRGLPWHSTAVPPDRFDSWIYIDLKGSSVWLSKTREVWRVAPGQKPLRLNPPTPH